MSEPLGAQPHYADDSVTLYHGDSLDVARELASGSVDCIVTSPPYFGLRDYGVEGQYGLEASPAAYVETMRALFSELRRALSMDGTLWLNIGDSYATHDPGGYRPGEHLNPGGRQAKKGSGRNRAGTRAPGLTPKNLMGIPWRVAFALQDDGWILRNAVVWSKPNAMPESVTDRLSSRYEMVFMFSKAKRYWFDLNPIRAPHSDVSISRQNAARKSPTSPGKAGTAVVPGEPRQAGFASGARELNKLGANPGDVWDIPTQGLQEAHFAVMAPALAERCVQAGCKPGGTVLDPFSGSGTTGLAAAKHGRKYIGIDLNSDYLDLSLRTRLRQPGLDFGDGEQCASA